MSETVTVLGLRDILRRLGYLRYDIGDLRAMDEIGLFLTSRIAMRTQEGRDVNGMPFEPYSEGYAKYRRKKGHDATRVNLFFTGSMQAAMTHKASHGEVRLFFSNTSDPSGVRNPAKAFWHHTGAAPNPERRFFAMNEDDRRHIVDIVDRHIRRLRRRR